MITRLSLFICLFASAVNYSTAQTVYFQQNVDAVLQTGTFMSINGDMLFSGNGKIYNRDTIFLNGNFENNSSDSAFDKNTDGWLKLNGASQVIKGTSVSAFNNLSLEGSDDKSAEIDAEVYRRLLLNDKAFIIDSNVVWIMNSDSNAVQFIVGSGYVNSTNTGGLARKTAANNNYLYPLGDVAIFRPVVVQPGNADENVIKVSFINKSPDIDGYPTTALGERVCDINDLFYHEYTHIKGQTDINFGLFFDPVTETEINDAAYWRNALWNNYDTSLITLGVFPTPSGTFDVVQMQKFYLDSLMTPVVLATTSNENADAGIDDTINIGASASLGGSINIIQDANGVIFDWLPAADLDCPTCPNPSANPSADATYALEITTPEGCVFKDSVTIFVKVLPEDTTDPGEFLCPNIPNAITPSKATNATWKIRCLSNYPNNTLVVFNRWGDEVYGPVQGYQSDWSGTWKGKELPEGTYYYVLRFFDAQNIERQVDGTITILR